MKHPPAVRTDGRAVLFKCRRHRLFTRLTQSGVSQHIRRLEEQLGVPLFLRIHKKVMLTEAGTELYRYVERFFDEQAALKQTIAAEFSAPRGPVHYAMPESCLLSPHFPLLLSVRKKAFPDIKLEVTLCPSDRVIDKLVQGSIAFGFVTTSCKHPNVDYRSFCHEEYAVVGAPLSDRTKLTSTTVLTQTFIEHPGVEALFDLWKRHHFPKARRLTWGALRIAGRTNSLKAAIMMATAGAGLTLLPVHCVQSELTQGTLARLTVPGNPLRNQIHLVSLSNVRQPLRIQTVIDAFLAMRSS
ncbi:MAG: LysR family transcriptional regulator [Myxococcota bacterium]